MLEVEAVSREKYTSYEYTGFYLEYTERDEDRAYFLCDLEKFKLCMPTNYLNEDIKNALNKLCSGENDEPFVLIK